MGVLEEWARKQRVADMESFSIAPQSRSSAVSKARVCFCCLIMATAFVVGCGVKDSNPKFYLVSAQVQLPYWRAAGSGFLDAAKQLKLKAEFVGPQTYDPKAQQLDFERIVESKPSGILISVANAELMKVDIDAAVAAGIPVITIDADSPNSKRMAFIGADNYLAGVMGAKVVAKKLHLKGNVAVFTIPAMADRKSTRLNSSH